MNVGYRVERFRDGVDVSTFDCGRSEYNGWLRQAGHADAAGSAAVYLLIRERGDLEDVVGYFALAPTAVISDDLPRAARGGRVEQVPGYLIAKLAVDISHQGKRWGSELLREALARIVDAADLSGGRVVVVDPDGEGLRPFYEKHGFLPTGTDRMYMKVATARRLVLGLLDSGR